MRIGATCVTLPISFNPLGRSWLDDKGIYGKIQNSLADIELTLSEQTSQSVVDGVGPCLLSNFM